MKRKFIIIISFVCLCIFSGWDLNLTLNNSSEVEGAGGIIEGGEFTPEGWRVTSQFNRIQIPIPLVAVPLRGSVRISIKNMPQNFPNRIENPSDPSVLYPYGRTLIGIGGRDLLWSTQGVAANWSYWLPCEGDDPGYRGIFRHIHTANISDRHCWATPVYNSHWCIDPGEILTLEYSWDSYSYNVLENGNPVGVTCVGGPPGAFLSSDQLFIHIATYEGLDPYGGVNGDITGAVFFNLSVHIEEDSSPVEPVLEEIEEREGIGEEEIIEENINVESILDRCSIIEQYPYEDNIYDYGGVPDEPDYDIPNLELTDAFVDFIDGGHRVGTIEQGCGCIILK